MNIDLLRTLVANHWGLEFGTTTAEALVGYEDLNFRLRHPSGRQYVLKVAASGRDPATLDMQHRVLRHLRRKAPDLAVPRVCTTLDGEDMLTLSGNVGEQRLVRLLTYLPGGLLDEAAPGSPTLLRGLGTLLGKLDRALVDFDDPAADTKMDWDLAHAADLRSGVPLLEDGVRQQVTAILDRFDSTIAPRLPRLPRSVIHGDANGTNVLVGPGTGTGGGTTVTGLIDFGDLVRTATVCEPAIALAYALADSPDPLASATTLVAGYHAQHPLGADELDLLFDLIRTRVAMNVTRAAEAAVAQPDNAYCQISAAPGRRLLTALDRLDPQSVREAFERATTTSPPGADAECG